MDVAGSQSPNSRELRVLNEGTAAIVGQPIADGPSAYLYPGAREHDYSKKDGCVYTSS